MAGTPPAATSGYDWRHVVMLTVLVIGMGAVFLLGLLIILDQKNSFTATDIVTVVALPLTALGTVSAGVFGYSLGNATTEKANEVASQTLLQAEQSRSDLAALVTPVVQQLASLQQQGTIATAGSEATNRLLDSARPLSEWLARQ